MRRLLVMALALGWIANGGAPPQASLLEDGAYQTVSRLDDPFIPIEPVDALSLVWLESPPHDASAARLLKKARADCDDASDPEHCALLLYQTIIDTAALAEDERDTDPFPTEECGNCPPEGGYLFVVSGETARLITRAEALDLFGEIDAPGEAMITLGVFAKVRQDGENFELITQEHRCETFGPKWTVWSIDRAGYVTHVVDWLENAGYTCDDE